MRGWLALSLRRARLLHSRLLGFDERSDAVDGIEIVIAGLMGFDLDPAPFFNETYEFQRGHGIQNSAGAQRGVVLEIGRLFAGQKFHQNVLPQFFFYVVHVIIVSTKQLDRTRAA